MPEHFHLLVSEPERDDLSQVMQVLKQRVARRTLSELKRSGTVVPEEEHFWQSRFYDFNAWSAAKHAEKVHHIHQNPVRRGLVAEPDQWFWSSFRAYACREPGIVAVNAPGSAKLKVRNPAARKARPPFRKNRERMGHPGFLTPAVELGPKGWATRPPWSPCTARR